MPKKAVPVVCAIPAVCESEFQTVTAQDLSDLKAGILEFIAAGKSRDDTVSALMNAGWSPDASDWAYTSVRIYGESAILGKVVHRAAPRPQAGGSPVAGYLVSALVLDVSTFAIAGAVKGSLAGAIFCLLSFIAARVLLFRGLADWADKKGYPRGYAWLGIVPLLGLLVVAALPNAVKWE